MASSVVLRAENSESKLDFADLEALANDSAHSARIGSASAVTESALLELSRVLRGGAVVDVEGVPAGNEEALRSQLTMSGFVEVEFQEAGEGVKKVSAKKPEWAGAAQPLKLGGQKKAKVESAAGVWKLDEGDMVEQEFQQEGAAADEEEALLNAWNMAGEEDGFVDEEELLKDANLIQTVKSGGVANNDDCGTGAAGSKKACDNCTCGRADGEAAERPSILQSAATTVVQNGDKKQIVVDTAKIKSNCGSCALGDAFRCAGCPALGLPAFKAGDKIVLDMTDDL